jgi:zinc transporter ZupT
MNLKTRAMIRTAKIISASIALSLALTYLISQITLQQATWIALAGLVGFFIYIVYVMTLSELTHQEELKKVQSIGE